MSIDDMNESFTVAERRRVHRQLAANRELIVAEWATRQFDPDRLARWRIAGVDVIDGAGLRRMFVEPLFALLAGYLLNGAPRWRALYRDERLRYAPHQAPPDERARFFAEILPRDEEDLVAAVEAPLRTALKRELAAIHAPLLAPSPVDLTVLALGDCLMNELRVFVPDACHARGIAADVRCLYFSAAAGRGASTARVREFLARHPAHVIACSFLSYDALPLYSALLRDADGLTPRQIEERAMALIPVIRHFLDDLREVTDVPVLVHNASGLPLTRIRRRLPLLRPLSAGRQRVVATLNAAIAELVAHCPNTLLVDEMSIAQAHGHRMAMRSVVPGNDEALFHTARFGEFLAKEYADVLASYHCMRKAKVLAVDFDNTLWHGVMADGPVVHHRQRQRMLRDAKDAGMLLVAVSKNDPTTIRWQEMELTPDDFVLLRIGWDQKATSIRSAAQQLGLGVDSFVLLDDSSAERELVRLALPQVPVLDSTDPFTWRAVERLLRFPNTKATDEARHRTALYRAAAKRQEALTEGLDFGIMMRALDLSLEWRRATHRDLERLTELVQRTNQFNTTTRRYTRQQLQELLASPRHGVYVASLADKFGSLGLVLTAIVERSGAEARIVAFVMSCRAMGFQTELAAMRLLLDSEPQVARWIGDYVPSDRNSPCANLFADCGFAGTDEGEWLLEARAQGPSLPAWFRIHGDAIGVAASA